MRSYIRILALHFRPTKAFRRPRGEKHRPHSHIGTGFKELALPWYTDQILPFDITLAATNEYGAAACARLFGVEILNEGYGMSIDDAVSEMQATFVARSVSPMQAVGTTSILV